MFLLPVTNTPSACHIDYFSCILALSNAFFGHFSSFFAFLFLADSPPSVFPSLLNLSGIGPNGLVDSALVPSTERPFGHARTSTARNPLRKDPANHSPVA